MSRRAASDSPHHGPVHGARRPRHDRAVLCEGDMAFCCRRSFASGRAGKRSLRPRLTQLSSCPDLIRASLSASPTGRWANTWMAGTPPDLIRGPAMTCWGAVRMARNTLNGLPGTAFGGRMSRRTSAEMTKPDVCPDYGPCDRAACPTESHLSHRIPLIPPNPTYPTESHLSRLVPLNPAYPTESRLSHGIPLNPAHPTESHLSHGIPLNPGESRIRTQCSIPPPPVPLPTCSYPSVAGRSLRSLGSAPFGARRGRAVRAYGPGGRRGYVVAQVFSPSPPFGGGEGRGEEGALAHALPAGSPR